MRKKLKIAEKYLVMSRVRFCWVIKKEFKSKTRDTVSLT